MGVRQGGRRGLGFFFFVFAPAIGLLWTAVCDEDVSLRWRTTVAVGCTVLLLISTGRTAVHGLREGLRLLRRLRR
jgi:hypothetical protein